MPSPAKAQTKAKEDFVEDELEEEIYEELMAISKELKRAQIAQDFDELKRLQPFYERRREVVKKVDKFWPSTLNNHGEFAVESVHRDDQVALSYLKDVWLVRDPKEPRAFIAEFHFAENPYFTDSVLKKEYKYDPQPPEDASEVPSSEPGPDGVSEAMIAFKWERDVKPLATTVHWKSDAKNLCKLYPRQVNPEDPEDLIDSGSFFNYFTSTDDPNDLAMDLADEVFPNAIKYFLHLIPGHGPDEDITDDEEEDDDDEGSVDLDHPKKKVKKS